MYNVDLIWVASLQMTLVRTNVRSAKRAGLPYVQVFFVRNMVINGAVVTNENGLRQLSEGGLFRMLVVAHAGFE